MENFIVVFLLISTIITFLLWITFRKISVFATIAEITQARFFYDAEIKTRVYDSQLVNRNFSIDFIVYTLINLLFWLPRKLITLGKRFSHALLTLALILFGQAFFGLMLMSRRQRNFYGKVGGKIPSKLYEGDSSQIFLQFPAKESLKDYQEMEKNISYRLDNDGVEYPSLEMELQASGFKVSGEPSQKQSVRTLPLIFTWNITAEKSGSFEIGIITRFYRRPNCPPESVLSIHKIRVVKLIFLSSRQLWLITGMFGCITTILGIIQTLVTLKIITLP